MATLPVTNEQYRTIINALISGFTTDNGIDYGYVKNGLSMPGVEANLPVATILQIEANTGLRIGDVLSLRRGDIVKVGNKYRFDITEQKTGKKRTFTVPAPVFMMIEDYCYKYKIKEGQPIFNIGVRNVQKILKKVCDTLHYEKISTHSFRKYFATNAYRASGNDIELVRRLLQHSSATTTTAYIGITDERTEGVLNALIDLV